MKDTGDPEDEQEIDGELEWYFYKQLRRYRFPVRNIKEKYGTLRVYTGLGWHNLLNLTHPGYGHYSPYPKWLMTFDIYYGPQVMRYTGLAFISYTFHKVMYRKIYFKAVKKWPNLKSQILQTASYPDLLK